MPIEVYPSLLPGRPLETYEVTGGTLGTWMDEHAAGWRERAVQPVQITVNGEVIPASAWDATEIHAADCIEIRVVPAGGVFDALGKIISTILDPIFGWLMPSASTPSTGSPNQGEKLETSEATANQAKLTEVVPELFGRYQRFPDYLTPPRRYFVNKREQHVAFMTCIGVGSYSIDPATIKIGDTPMDQLDGKAEYRIYAPGEDVTGSFGHDHWYSVDEVGGTSSGTAGLTLSSEPSTDVPPTATTYTLQNANVIAMDGTFPEVWAVGTILDIPVFRAYTTEDLNDVHRIVGNFREISPAVGKHVLVRQANAADVEHEILDFEIDANGDGWIALVDQDAYPNPDYNLWLHIEHVRYRISGIASATQIGVAAYNVDEGGLIAGWAGFAPFSGTITITADASSIVYGDWAGPFHACPANAPATTFEVDFFFTGGLARIEDDGDLSVRTVPIQVQYRNAVTPEDGWTTVDYTYSDNTMDQIGFTERITIASPTILEFRVRRVGARDASTQIRDEVVWYGLRSMQPTKSSYPNWTTMAVRLNSGGQLGAQSENKINLIATRLLPELQADGSWTGPVATRQIAAAFRYILTTIGYSDSQIDMDELRRLNDTWNARGETFNYVFDETTVKEALNTALVPGNAAITIDNGRVRPVRDELRTTFEQVYSPQNMTKPLRWTFQSRRVDDSDGVEVEYTDPDTWTKETIVCLLPGDNGFKLDKLPLKGAFTRTQAWRLGMRRRRVLRYRNRQYSFSTELDALNSRYLSRIGLEGDDPGYAQSCILTDITDSGGGQALFRVSEPLNWIDGAEHVVGWRWPDGTLAGPIPATPGPDEYSLYCSPPDAWPEVTLKQEPPHIYFGTTTRWLVAALATEIRPNGMETVDVSAVNDDPRVYADDDNAPE